MPSVGQIYLQHIEPENYPEYIKKSHHYNNTNNMKNTNNLILKSVQRL